MALEDSTKWGIAAGIAGGAVFVLFFIFLSLPLIASLIAGAVAFGAAFLIVRGKGSADMVFDFGVDRAMYDAVITEGARKTHELREQVGKIPASAARVNALRICDLADRIVEDVTHDPKDARAASQFMNYYLDTTLKIVSQYIEISSKKIKSDDIDEVLAKVEKLFETLETAFEKQLARLLDDNVMDLDAELTLLEKTIQLDGIFDASAPKSSPKKRKTTE